MKLIFKKRGEEYVGRFHHECGVTALNPLTNNRLIGEIEFYFIENPYLQIEPPESRYPRNQPLSLKGVSGKFIGSDYNFIYSSHLRQIVLSNCIEENKSVYMKFQDYKSIDFRI